MLGCGSLPRTAETAPSQRALVGIENRPRPPPLEPENRNASRTPSRSRGHKRRPAAKRQGRWPEAIAPLHHGKPPRRSARNRVSMFYQCPQSTASIQPRSSRGLSAFSKCCSAKLRITARHASHPNQPSQPSRTASCDSSVRESDQRKKNSDKTTSTRRPQFGYKPQRINKKGALCAKLRPPSVLL